MSLCCVCCLSSVVDHVSCFMFRDLSVTCISSFAVDSSFETVFDVSTFSCSISPIFLLLTFFYYLLTLSCFPLHRSPTVLTCLFVLPLTVHRRGHVPLSLIATVCLSGCQSRSQDRVLHPRSMLVELKTAFYVVLM